MKKYLTSDYIPLESCDFNYITIIPEIEYKNYLYFQSKFEHFDISLYAGFDTYEIVDVSSENFKEISDEEYKILDKLINLWGFDFDFLDKIRNKIDYLCNSEKIDYETSDNFWWDLPEEKFKESLDEFISKFKEKFENYHEYYYGEDLLIIELK